MIEINLLPGQKKRKAAGAGFKLSLPDFRALLATIKDPYLIAAVAAWVLALGGGGALFVLDQAQLAALEHRLDDVKVEKRRFDILIANKRRMEVARDSLLAEIIVIRRIDEDRYVWPHLLDQLTKSLPPYTWLTEVAPTNTTTIIEADRPVTQFNLVARYRPPTDPRFVHTVPLAQSVR